MHGDADPSQATITRLDGTDTHDLRIAVEDLDRVLRLALHRTLSGVGHPSRLLTPAKKA
jgi:hypothetical protein